MEVRHNLEIKARLASCGTARRLVQQLGARRVGQQIQTDTYFHSRQGRLKLREIVGRTAQLIWYERPDKAEPKTSRYYLAEIPDPDTTRAALAAGLGTRCVVKKRREIYLYRNVRIHLDHVDDLGQFLELEAVVEPQGHWDEAERLLADLMERLHVDAGALLQTSYGDLLAAAP